MEDWVAGLDLKWVGVLSLGAKGDEKQLGNSDSPGLFFLFGKLGLSNMAFHYTSLSFSLWGAGSKMK